MPLSEEQKKEREERRRTCAWKYCDRGPDGGPATFIPAPKTIRAGGGKYCSVPCANLGRSKKERYFC